MSNFKRINANNIVFGEYNAPNPSLQAEDGRIQGQVDITDGSRGQVISYNQSTDTINFHNKPITGFSGGSGSGGDVFLANTQTFSGVNTFNGNTILTTVDSGNLNTVGTISATGNISGASVAVTGNLECNTGTLECNDCEVTNNCTIASGNLVVTAGTASVGGFLSTNGITNTGDISTTTQTTTSNHIIGGDCVVTGQIVSNGGLSVNSGNTTVGALSTNNQTISGTVTCNNNIAAASLTAQAGDISATAGNINGLSLQSNGGQVLLKTGNARVEDDTNNDVRIQADANTNTIVCRLGATGADNLQLSFDSGTNKSVLKLYDFTAGQYYNVGASPDDLTNLIASINNTSLTFNPTTTGTFQGSLVSTGTTTMSGTVINLGTGVNTSTITAMNDTADRLNVNAGKIQLDATATLAKSGTASGGTDIFTACDTILDRSALSFTPTLFTLVTGTPTGNDIQLAGSIINSVQASVQAVRFGTNSGTPVYRVSCRGRLTGFQVNNIGAGSGSINLFTLPAGYRPTIEQNIISQGHPDEGQIRIDISTSGLVSIAEGASTNNAQFCNLGGIDIWAGI